MDAFATSISLALQHGVPLKVLCEKFAHTRFEPSGWTGNEQIGYAKSLMDYIFRWLNLRFLSGEQLTLFAGLAPQAPQLPASPSCFPRPSRTRRSMASQAPGQVGRRGGQAAEPGERSDAAVRQLRAAAALRPNRIARSLRTTPVCPARCRTSRIADLPRSRCHARNVRDGRCAQLLHLRRHHGPQRQLLPLHELRFDERMQLVFIPESVLLLQPGSHCEPGCFALCACRDWFSELVVFFS